MHRSSIAFVIAAAGCAGSSTTSPLSSHPQAHAGMRFTNAVVAKTHAKSSKHIDLPFQLKQAGVNGTALLLGFLQKIEPDAAYVTDVSYSLQMVYKGMAVECVSKILVEDGSKPPAATPAAAPAPAPPSPDDAEFSTDVAPWRPDMTDSWVVDRELHCKPHAVVTQKTEVVHPVEYAAEVKRNLSPEAWSIKQDMFRIERNVVQDSVITYTDECGFDPNKRFVHRYEHFVAARFMPPDLDLIRKVYSDFPLGEAPPECHRIDHAAEAPLRQHLTADVYYTGAVKLEEPLNKDTLTGRPAIDRQ